MATKKTSAKTKAGDAPKGVEIVPLLVFRPGRAGSWGDQYVSGLLNTTTNKGTTFPGHPIRVKDAAYAEAIVEAKLAAWPDSFTLDQLPAVFRGEFGNPERWSSNAE